MNHLNKGEENGTKKIKEILYNYYYWLFDETYFFWLFDETDYHWLFDETEDKRTPRDLLDIYSYHTSKRSRPLGNKSYECES